MANITATGSLSNVIVSSTASNISITDFDTNVIVSNIDNAITSVTVASTDSVINVSQTSTVSNSDVRLAISAVDAGGDGSFSYNNTSGVFTYTGPSQAEVLAHFSNVSPVNLEANGQISVDDSALFSGKTTDDSSTR